MVALSLVLVILLVVYRSAILPFAVLATSVFALCVALLTNWWLAKAGILTLTGQTQGILFILVIGAATDYSLLYTARYAEELRRHRSRADATRAALKGVVEPILASGGTVIAGLLCLLLSDLGSNRSLGPVASIGIAFAMASALTLLPSLLYLLGRVAYWPRRPRFDPTAPTISRPTPASTPASAPSCRVARARCGSSAPSCSPRRRLRPDAAGGRRAAQRVRARHLRRPRRPGPPRQALPRRLGVPRLRADR
ncbi:MMPL family transporter [Tessaracoccus coleopterorum]|uniref:MMPL family transporter n=1 Tax=Tessaracoccus coleopterorum TaxID=2714950 RepID=UPI002F914E3C